MTRYLISTNVDNAEGTQTWYVDASTEGEALTKFKAGAGEIYSTEVEVTSLGEPAIAGIVDDDDTGEFEPNAATKFWQAAYPEGLTAEGVQAELADYHGILEGLPELYMHITGGQCSKPNTSKEVVRSLFEDHVTELVEEAVREATTETNWEDLGQLCQAAASASSHGLLSGTSNWAAHVSAYMRKSKGTTK